VTSQRAAIDSIRVALTASARNTGRGLDPVPAFVDGLRAILVNGSAQEFGENADAAIPANEGKT
jgi:hypothetical protein